jgi:hypothetical protein
VAAELIHALFMAKASILGVVLTRVRKSSNARFRVMPGKRLSRK